MSGRGGIYKGPGGEELFGDGREVHPISLEAQQAKKRSPNYKQMTPQEQWEEDKRLGILDWDGK
jgi:hypothetical protein